MVFALKALEDRYSSVIFKIKTSLYTITDNTD